VLDLIGLVMVLSASSVGSILQHGSPWYYFERQVLWLALGAAAWLVTVGVDYRRWRPLSVPALAGCVVLLLAVLVPGIGVGVAGSSRWLGLGSWRIQPSEFAKLALILFAADVLDRRGPRIRDWRYAMLPVLAAFAAVALLVMAQPDMGTTMVIACIVIAMLYVGGSRLLPMSGTLAAGAVATLFLALAAPYRWQRLTSFLHPLADASNTGYQSVQGLIFLGTGHLTGVGLGADRAGWGYLPNAYTDFIFAIIGEETGLFGTITVVALFAALAFVGVRIASRAPDRFGSLLASGITAWLVGQALINIGAVVGLLPVTGVPLPFVSFGGSSLLIALGASGILANVARQAG
jgi:cell division protein FtsW